jgi:hypothetical protein
LINEIAVIAVDIESVDPRPLTVQSAPTQIFFR